jgi:choline dehydrogenase-like flavoprotein
MPESASSYERINVTQSPKEYDAIVVGSGVTGGWAAKEFTEKGLDTLCLERGRHVEHGDDYVTEHKEPWEMDYHGRGSAQEMKEHYPVQSQAGPVNAYNKHFFVKDSKHPYETSDDSSFMWIRGYQLGGRSITWGRQCYRWSDLDFTANKREGIAVDWPIRYDDIAPWYDYVEDYVGLTGQEEGLPQLPDGNFLPPMEMNVAEKDVKAGLEESFSDRIMTIGRAAILTRPHKGRSACHYCGPCSRGCSAGAYFCSLSSTLPAARATGNLTLKTDSIVHSVIYDEETGRASGVRVIDANTKETREYKGRVVFLCASTFGSTKIMLNSTSSRFPNGIANSSGALGKYVMDHHFKVGASGTVPGHMDRYTYGDRPNGIYIPRFRNLGRTPDADVDFLRGYGYQGGASREGWGRAIGEAGFGADLKHSLREPGRWRFGITAFGEMLPREDNYVELHPDKTDEWGMPVLRFDVSTGENEALMREDMAAQAAEMLEAAGCEDVSTYDADYTPGEGIHEMGTARMGRNPDTSVLNRWNQAHDVPNLFVTDGACMTSAACQNPSITYMALTARAVDYATKEMERQNI